MAQTFLLLWVFHFPPHPMLVSFFGWCVMLFSEFVSLSSYHLVSRTLLVYAAFFSSAGLHPSRIDTIRISLSNELL